ncbi:protein kinase, putative [Entamoeba histolytica HM-1:IMSS]|uniref:Protein kinase, putative n=2 Tax=Entamoeba histolytica (strain ATCC 30459 / HM-1:IMSS / ABRM) TaxID=294381 RepID=C4LTI6_ENTH1|nr:protein kinase, putative [Entamoeba histolytica HM-1:IMSS]EAL50831.2 protein kinase, putative [Entamoeba histolytica HM-1:IMSS]ENY63946.1 protein kinase, putative [Entamoeba histolytica HM-1:IMSS-A]|eukprot:XP_656217.2 protein kinase, putative [Entamoeba histolytica HM-1:IMSS]
MKSHHLSPSWFNIYIEEGSTENIRHKPDTRALTKQLTGRIRETYWHIYPTQHSLYTNKTPIILNEITENTTNSGFDNEEYDLIIKEGDILGSATSYEGRYYSANPETVSRYQILNRLGNGMFGQVFKAKDLSKEREVAIKILKSKGTYFRQGMLEISILSMLNDIYDKDGTKNTVRMLDHFLYCNHLCIVFELLGTNLYQMLQKNEYHGLNIIKVKKFMTQLLECLDGLYNARIVHCDIKPENLVFDQTTNGIKVIDFGSACFDNYTLYTYVQSRHYRAPEIILGLPYNNAIDMWSAGCIAAELVLGIPLFPGSSEFNQLFKITDMLGLPPKNILEQGSKTLCYFNKLGYDENAHYIMKQPFEYEMENRIRLEPNKKYFRFKTLKELIMRIPLKLGGGMKEEITNLTEIRLSLIHFIEGMLQYDPMKRWTPSQALYHPFLTGQQFTGHWEPPLSASQPRPPEDDILSGITSDEFAKKCFGNDITLHGLNTAEYYDICTSALQMGEVVNITCPNPFQLPPMTPDSFRKAFENIHKRERSGSGSRITRRRSSLLRNQENPYRAQLKQPHTPRSNGISPMKIVQEIHEGDDFFENGLTTVRRRFDSCNARMNRTPLQEFRLQRNERFKPNDVGSVKLEDRYNNNIFKETAIVHEPSNVNIPIVPVPIRRSDTGQDPFEFAPLFIFGEQSHQ